MANLACGWDEKMFIIFMFFWLEVEPNSPCRDCKLSTPGLPRWLSHCQISSSHIALIGTAHLSERLIVLSWAPRPTISDVSLVKFMWSKEDLAQKKKYSLSVKTAKFSPVGSHSWSRKFKTCERSQHLLLLFLLIIYILVVRKGAGEE